MFSPKSSAALIAATFILAGCGSDSDDDPAPVTQTPPPSQSGGDQGSDQPQTLTGVFVDSPVAGVSYTTSPSGKEGVTNTVGEYDYEDGDTVRFSIGGIEFPEVSAKGTVTPLDMGGENADLTTPEVVNVIRLLQTLDEDGDPENGITISDETATALADTVLDFSAATFDSEASTAVSALSRELVSSDEAVAHFQGSLQGGLQGSWVYEEEGGNVNVLTFFGNNRYVIAHSQADDGDQTAGSAEYGAFSWDPVSGDFSVTNVIHESDGSGGLYNADEPAASQGLTLSIEQGVLTLEFSDGSVDFTLVESTTGDDLLGTWYFREPESDDRESGVLLTFLNDTDYVLVHTWNSEAYVGDPVINVTSEWNTYEWADDGTFNVGEPSVETDGPAGLYDANDSDSMQVALSNNGDLTLGEAGAEQESLARVGRFEVQLQDFEGDNSTTTVKRAYGRFGNGVARTFELEIPGEGESGTYDDEIAETVTITLDSDGSGSMSWGNVISEWEVSTSGALTFTEYDGDPADAATWTITPITGKTGDAVLVEQHAMDLSFLSRATTPREFGYAEADFSGLVYNVYGDGSGAWITELTFEAGAGTFTGHDEEAAEDVSGTFSFEEGGKVLQMNFDGGPSHFAVYLSHDATGPSYAACWADDQDAANAAEAVTWAQANPGECIDYFTTSADEAEIIRTGLAAS